MLLPQSYLSAQFFFRCISIAYCKYFFFLGVVTQTIVVYLSLDLGKGYAFVSSLMSCGPAAFTDHPAAKHIAVVPFLCLVFVAWANKIALSGECEDG